MDFSFNAAIDFKLYEGIRHKLADVVEKTVVIFPALEAAQPRESGLQALCMLRWSLDKAKSLLQYCTDSSKLYLAITGGAMLVRFERVRDSLNSSLRRLEQLAPRDLAQQVGLILSEVEQLTIGLNSADQEAGHEIMALFQMEKAASDSKFSVELDLFYNAALRLGIASGKAALDEKKALKRLHNKAHIDGDKKKERIAAYLLHVLRLYMKKFDPFSKGPTLDGLVARESHSYPSPSEMNQEASMSGRNINACNSNMSYLEGNEHQTGLLCGGASGFSGEYPPAPEEFRCPISLQLMSDPVIVSSGQTYERVCIEKWFEEGHITCPKTQQKLSNLTVTPNYCVKGLIASWCEMHRMPIPHPPSPPPSLVTDWRWGLPANSSPTEETLYYLKGEISGSKKFVSTTDKIVADLSMLSIEDCGSVSRFQTHSDDSNDKCCYVEKRGTESPPNKMQVLENLLPDLESSSLEIQCKVAEKIYLMVKDNAEARLFIGNIGGISSLVEFLHRASDSGKVEANELATLALLNVAIDNNRNKAEIVAAGAVSILLKLLSSEIPSSTQEAAIMVLLTLSGLDENKLIIGSSGAIPVLVDLLDRGSEQSVKDALTTLCDLSLFTSNRRHIINAEAVPKLVQLLNHADELSEKCMALLYNVSSLEEGRFAIAQTENCIALLAEVLDHGSTIEKEYAMDTCLLLCLNSARNTQCVLREGVIPSLVMLAACGSARGKDNAQKLLQHFREQRQKDSSWHASNQAEGYGLNGGKLRETGKLSSVSSRGGIRQSLSYFKRSKLLLSLCTLLNLKKGGHNDGNL